jgi:excisionase family DNA binding protein
MSEAADLPNIPGYVSVKEAAKILRLAERTVYEYVAEGRLPGGRAADVIMIPEEEVKRFKLNPAGRPRKTTPSWRKSSGDNTQYITFITVQAKTGQQHLLAQKLEEIRRREEHIFPGTVARYIVCNEQHTDRIEIILVWRSVVMPDEATRELALEAFRQYLADVLDWKTAQYSTSKVLLHT